VIKNEVEEIPNKMDPKSYKISDIGDLVYIKYRNSKQNIKIDLIMNKSKKIILLDHFSAYYIKKNPRAEKGLARIILCELIKNIVKKYNDSINYDIVLVANNLNIKNFNYDMEKQIEMYKKLGFVGRYKESINELSQPVKKFIDLCDNMILKDSK
jgi:hypothetical protein